MTLSNASFSCAEEYAVSPGQSLPSLDCLQEEVMAQAAAARNIPPHHPEATLAHDAYRYIYTLSKESFRQLHL